MIEKQICIACGQDKARYARNMCQACHRRKTRQGRLDVVPTRPVAKAQTQIDAAKARAARLR